MIPVNTKNILFICGGAFDGIESKIANRLKSQGHSVLLAAADTFRAAAIEQLSEWARRIGIDVIKHQANADPSAVVTAIERLLK